MAITYYLDRDDFIYFVKEEHAYLRRYISDNVITSSDGDLFVKNIRFEYDPYRAAYILSYSNNVWSGEIGRFGSTISRNVDDSIVNQDSQNLPTTKAVVDFIKTNSAGTINDIIVDGKSVVNRLSGLAEIPYASETEYGVVIIGKNSYDAFDGYIGNWIYEHFDQKTGNLSLSDTATYIVDDYGHRLSYDDLFTSKLSSGRGLDFNISNEIELNDEVVGSYVVDTVKAVPFGHAQILVEQASDGFLYLEDIPQEGFRVHGIVHNTSSGKIKIDVPKGNIYGNKYYNIGADTVTIPKGMYAEFFCTTINGEAYIKMILSDNDNPIYKHIEFCD